jgi:hypothetical protein
MRRSCDGSFKVRFKETRDEDTDSNEKKEEDQYELSESNFPKEIVC